MKKIWKILVMILIYGALIFSNIVLIRAFISDFPNNGGFSRNLIYIRPTNTTPGYYIIIDELNDIAITKGITTLFHGRGTLKTNLTDQSATWSVKSYLNASENVSLYLKYITPIQKINKKSGLYVNEDNIYKETPYIEVSPKLGTRISSAILYPLNSTMSLPSIKEGENYIWINNKDFILIQNTIKNKTINNITTDAKFLFLRKGLDGNLMAFLIIKGTLLIYNNTRYYCNKTAQTVAWHNGTFQSSQSYHIKRYISKHKLSYISNFSHPFLYYNKTSFISIKQRVLNSSPWKDWTGILKNKADSILKTNISALTPPIQADDTIILAFMSQIMGNSSYLQKTKDFLKEINNITDYTGDSEHLRRSIALMKYVLAYDMVYQNLTSYEKDAYKKYICNDAQVLYDSFWVTPRNNHKLILSGAIGLVGLTFNKLNWVQTAINAIDTYLNTNIKAEGGCYEGQGYSGYGFLNVLRFIYALKNVGIDYFQDINFQNVFKFNINSTSPLGTIPIFEDTRRNPEVAEMCLWISPHVPFGVYLKWLYDRRSNQSATFSMLQPSISRLILYDSNVSSQTPEWYSSGVYTDSGLAFLRSDWSTKAQYMSFSCKSYIQSHTHFDENSIELWAYGAYLLVNPGYGTFGDEHYPWIISTEASNTMLINNIGQIRENADGIENYIFSKSIDYVSGSALNIYNHPSSIDSHPGIFMFLISILYLLIISLLLNGFIVWKSPNGIIKKPNFKSSESNAKIILNILLLRPEIFTKINYMKNKKLQLIFISSFLIISIIILYFFINSLFLSISPYLDAYFTPNSGYYELISIINIIKIAVYFSIIPITIMGLYIIRKTFYFSSKYYLQVTYNIESEKKWQLKNLEYLSIPVIIGVIICFIYFQLIWYPTYLYYLFETMTNSGSINHVMEMIISLSVFTVKNGYFLIISFILLGIWSIYGLTLQLSSFLSIEKKYISINIISLVCLIAGIILLILLYAYYSVIYFLGSFSISYILG